METKTVKIASLLADPANARKHDKKNIDAIKASLKQFGQRKNIVVRDGIIIAGNGTVEAAKELGWEDITIAVADDMSATEAKAFALADNRTAELAVWDDDVLGEQLQALYEDGYAIADFGFDWEDQSNSGGGQTDDDAVPEVEENVFGVKRGDIWQLGEHRLMCGDSTSKDNVDGLMNGEKADMVFTDPPYGMRLDTEYDKMFQSDTSHVKTGNRFESVIGDNQDYDPNHIFELFNCHTFLWGCDYYYDKLPKGGCFIAWDKRDENLDKVPGNPTEFCWSNKPVRRMSFRIKWSGHHGMQNDDTKKRVHPTQKPTKLVESFFETYANKKTNIVDLFLGSGSTLIACEKTGRKCYGMEIDPHYCSVIIKRYIDYVGGTDRVFKIGREGNKTPWSELPQYKK